jgi:hypothetical protein
VFVLSCFDPAIASRSPEKILTVGESSGGNSAKGKPSRQDATFKASESVGTSSQWAAGENADGVLTTSVTSKWHKGTGGPSGSEHYNLVVEPFLSFDTQFGSNANVFENMSPTLKSSQQSPSVMMPFTASSHAGYTDGVGTLRANGGDLGGGSETLLVQQTPPSAE